MITSIKKLNMDSSRYSVNVEIYNSFTDMLNDIDHRSITDPRFHNMRDGIKDKKWSGVKTYEEALCLLEEGYAPAVDRIYDEIRIKNGRRINGLNQGHEIVTSVVGYQPVIPLVLHGIPNNMLLRRVERVEARVFNIYIDTTCVNTTTIQELIRYGITLIKMIYNLEMCGHKINLYHCDGRDIPEGHFDVVVCDGFAGEASADLLCVKVKNSNTPLDLRRLSFPLCHTAFTRVISFDWYSKFPIGVYRERYGTTLSNILGAQAAEKLIKRVFGSTSVYITYSELMRQGNAYLKQILGIEKIA